MNDDIAKEEKSEIKDLNFHHEYLERDQIKPKVNERKFKN
jgi:hypothetical protein